MRFLGTWLGILLALGAGGGLLWGTALAVRWLFDIDAFGGWMWSLGIWFGLAVTGAFAAMINQEMDPPAKPRKPTEF